MVVRLKTLLLLVCVVQIDASKHTKTFYLKKSFEMKQKKFQYDAVDLFSDTSSKRTLEVLLKRLIANEKRQSNQGSVTSHLLAYP